MTDVPLPPGEIMASGVIAGVPVSLVRYTEQALRSYGEACAKAERERVIAAVRGLDCAHRCGIGWEIERAIRAGLDATSPARSDLGVPASPSGSPLQPPSSASAAIPDAILAIIERLHTQDNRITESPLFAVQQKREHVGADGYHDSDAKWVNDDNDTADDEDAARLDAEYRQTYEEPKGWRRVHVFNVWEFVTGCLTEQGCKDYITRNGHNLREPRIYAYGSYRNAEWIELRRWLMSLRAKDRMEPATGEPGGACGTRPEESTQASALPAAEQVAVGVVSDLFPALRNAAHSRGVPDDAPLYATLPKAQEGEPAEARYVPLPYATPLEMWRAFRAGAKFRLHYHDRVYDVGRMEPREFGVYVQPPGLPVKILPDGRNSESAGDAIWLEQVAAAPAAQPAPEVPAPQSLLRKPVASIREVSAAIPGGCYCPPDRCSAPVVMGRQTPCLRRIEPKDPA